jgi:hypothetical protein
LSLQQLWESPALIIPVAFILAAPPAAAASLLAHPLSQRTLLTAAFLAHYTYRVLVFPLCTRGGKPAPLTVMLASATFCVWNGLMQVSGLVSGVDGLEQGSGLCGGGEQSAGAGPGEGGGGTGTVPWSHTCRLSVGLLEALPRESGSVWPGR